MKRKIMVVLGLAAAVSMLSISLVHAMESSANVETLAGTGSHGTDDGMATQFNLPLGIASGPDGEILVADTFNSLIRTIDVNWLVSTLNLHFPEHDASGFPIGHHIDREIAGAFFNRPSGFAESRGWVFVADTHNHSIRVIIGDRVYTMAGAFYYGFADGARLEARFSYPSAVAVCQRGYVYVADTGNHAIRRIDHLGNVTTIAGTPGEYGYLNGEAASAMFDSPTGLVFCDDGRLFIADTGNHVIRVIEDGVVSTFAGSRTTLEGEDNDEWDDLPIGGFLDGDASEALFNRPMGLALWGDVLFVADSGNHVARAVVEGAGVITIAGMGYPGHMDGDFADAAFFLPSGLYVFGDMLLVADTGNNMIRRIDLLAVIALLE